MNAAIAYPKTLTEAVRYFSDAETSLNFFVAIRWPAGVCCPHCGSVAVSYLKNQRRWQCREKHARRQFSAKVGTIFEDSALSLENWMVAVWLEVNAKNSISSYELHRALGITQKSAWFMQHRIRLALRSGSFEKFGSNGNGGVEADETFIGGLARNMHKHVRDRKIGKGTGGVNKASVMGLLERHGEKKKSQVRTAVIPNRSRETLHSIIHKNVEPGAAIFTDAHHGYIGLSESFLHEFIDHAEKYVEGNVHTNGLENFWSLFKRCIKGTHVSVDPAHLFRYLDAECFRFNNRSTNDGERFLEALNGVSGKRITYAELIGKLDPVSRIASDRDAENASDMLS